MQKFLGLFLSFSLLIQTAAPALAADRPKKSFYEKAGWLDHQSNTLRRVAQLGEKGAYELYKNNNPAPRNQYERANIHAVNLSDLSTYQSSDIYRRAARIRAAFLAAGDAAEEQSAAVSLTPEDLRPIRAAVTELLAMHAREGEYYPIVAQTALQLSAALLPLDAQYHFFTPAQLEQLKHLQRRVLNHATSCGQNSGYSLFCEGRAEALHGLAILARTDEDAQTIFRALIQDLKEPVSAQMLPAGFQALLDLKRADLLEKVMQTALEKEESSMAIEYIFIRHWVDAIQNSRGNYLGKVTKLGRLPAREKEKAEGNVWEELAYIVAEAAPRQPQAKRLLERYAVGSCSAEVEIHPANYPSNRLRLSCRTLAPFLVGALNAGYTGGASPQLQKDAARLHLTPGAYVARSYFEKVLGDVDAETEYRIDGILHRVFAGEIKKAEEERQKALAHNREIDRQTAPLDGQLVPYFTGEKSYFQTRGDNPVPEGVRISAQIAEMQKRKIPVPDHPDAALKMYTRSDGIFRRKEIGQIIYSGAAWGAEIADFFWIGYLTGFVTGRALMLARGIRAVRAGQVTADARRLAKLSAELRKIDMEGALRLRRGVTQELAKSLSQVSRDAQAGRLSSAAKSPVPAPRKAAAPRAKASREPFVPKRSAHTGRFPSGLERDEELLRQWTESFKGGHFSPRDQVEAVAGMKPEQMNNILEYIRPMEMPQAERALMKPILRQGRLPRFMYEDKLIPRTQRLPHGYYKNRFNEKVQRLTELAGMEKSALVHQAELDNILTSMKDYTFRQGFSFPNDAAMTRGLHANWKELTSEVLTPGRRPNRLKMNELWQRPVQYAPGKSVSLEQYFKQKVKTVFFSEKSPDFFINSPKWVELENVRRNLAAADYMKRFGKTGASPWWERMQDWFVLGKRSDYLTLDQFGKVMADQYKRNPAVARALAEAESTPSSLTYQFNCHEGRACQAAITDGGAAYIPRGGYDGTRQMARFEVRTQPDVKAVVFEGARRPAPRVVDLKTVSYVKDLHPSDVDLIRAGKMVSDRVDETWDLLTMQQAAKTLPKIPDLKATIYPSPRLPGQTLPPDLTGGGINAYLTLFTKEFYPLKTVYRLRWKGLRPSFEPQYYVRKEVPALAGSIHRERLTFAEQVAERIVFKP